MKAIVAVDENFGLGMKGKLPWKVPSELIHFKSLTHNKKLVVGRKTAETLPYLPDREIICLTRKLVNTCKWKNEPYMFVTKLKDLKNMENEDILIAGGGETYKKAFKIPDFIDTVHISVIKGVYDCDTFFDRKWLHGFVIEEKKSYEDFEYYVLKRQYSHDTQYLQLLNVITESGQITNGRNGKTQSIFKSDFMFDLRKGFPLLTTKKMFLRGIVEEFLFFIKGKTDSTELSEKNVKIWEGNTTEEFIKSRGLNYAKGVMGPMYGYQWRHFNAPYETDEEGRPVNTVTGGVDQLKNVIDLIKNDPSSRRILMTTYNPSQAEEGVLYPCHSIITQFHVENDFLDMFCYNRSQDVFLGVPFNIASSSLLLIIVSKLTGKTPRFFHMTMGDTHIYETHYKQVEKQMKRFPYTSPILEIPDIKDFQDLELLKYSDFNLRNYNCHNIIKAEMTV